MLNHPRPNKPNSQLTPKGSLSQKTLFQITVCTALIVTVSAIANYMQAISALRNQKLTQLEESVVERVAREQQIFDLAADNHAILKSEILRKFAQPAPANLEEEFNNLLIRYPDGVIRNNPANFDGQRQAGVYIDKSLEITPEIRRKVIDLQRLIESYGSAWHNRFDSTFIMTPENITIVYWPQVPNYVQEADANFYMPQKPEYLVATPENNPQRKTVWTTPYYEPVSQLWLVTASTPVDYNGQTIGTLGHDITLNQLIERTVNNHIEGGYNLIFRGDGQLIAHPDLIDKIQDSTTTVKIQNLQDSNLMNIFKLVKNAPPNQFIIPNYQDDQYLVFRQMPGLNWYFVTVFPRSILRKQSLNFVLTNILIEVILLLSLMVLVWVVLKRQVSAPLQQLINATQKISAGDYNVSLADDREDELGFLAHSFNLMAAEISNRNKELQGTLQNQKMLVHEVTITMNELNSSARGSAEQASKAAVAAKQVLYLIKGDHEYADSYYHDCLQETVNKLADKISDLNNKIVQIGLISTMVSNFANQTNILALNAAVEAVQADHNSGQGFNVIANEIRKLADQSKSSAAEINNLVHDLKKAMSSTVRVTEESQTGFNEVVNGINSIVENSQTISLNINQQSVAIEQVLEMMNDLNVNYEIPR
ncbi:MAG: methyl-accepting chemotaxis protein [Limnospira sp. PMC 1291.21]|uniref:Signal transduction histidine kinase and methyl-accepting chemotaxis protein n=5 Tax=Oscillatoriales TaxID=1150 RepID=A0A9P1NYV4_9CYAN|nr:MULTISPECIES: methyl-accepting chemotaxis protein [Limnospira]EKD06879.1 methyl-accepting chemotaxis sensory transducer [Arthrospira platensis C1]QJB26360.1 HAMP domain-containing protein [Limnospira fusiformis SAG 85.79]RAQ40025.1 methyl-accepting chemotaxis protein [Arthrospira sp. O9.13F]CDM95542.1 Putative signal transduction histidine kinase and methyl-accepting chemotaxis protein [Limnospira indica PCC 8005]SMN35236.1 methyl-accepting chemotaxis protein [Arthrospira sp. SRM16]